VRAQGLLQPLLVERGDDGPVLIDGHRRLAALRAAGHTRAAVIYREGQDGEAAQLAAALAANLRRRGLGPIEEARAFERAVEAGWPQRRIAEAVGCSRRHVSERLRLLRLPEAVQEAIAEGALPLAAVARVEAIAKVSPGVAEALAAALRAGAVRAAELTHDPDGALAELGATEGEWTCPPLVALPGYQDLAAVLDSERHAEVIATAEAAGLHGVSLDSDDMDAARAYGCLIEFREGEDRYFRRGWVADPEWFADRVRLHAERATERAQERARRDAERRAEDERERAEEARRRAAERGEDPEAAAAEAAAGSDEERRRRERQEAAEDRRQARLANRDLGRQATLAYDEPEQVTIEMARALALTALHHHQAEAAQGLRLTQERLQRTETRTLKSGQTRERLTYAEPHEAEEALAEWIGRARTPEQVIGRAVQALLAAWYADQSALPQSERRPATVPGAWGAGLAAALPATIAGLARPVLPERLAARVRERESWQEGVAVAATPAGPDGGGAETG
jgi:ParB/RepB/Spo0J family partition protein